MPPTATRCGFASGDFGSSTVSTPASRCAATSSPRIEAGSAIGVPGRRAAGVGILCLRCRAREGELPFRRAELRPGPPNRQTSAYARKSINARGGTTTTVRYGETSNRSRSPLTTYLAAAGMAHAMNLSPSASRQIGSARGGASTSVAEVPSRSSAGVRSTPGNREDSRWPTRTYSSMISRETTTSTRPSRHASRMLPGWPPKNTPDTNTFVSRTILTPNARPRSPRRCPSPGAPRGARLPEPAQRCHRTHALKVGPPP